MANLGRCMMMKMKMMRNIMKRKEEEEEGEKEDRQTDRQISKQRNYSEVIPKSNLRACGIIYVLIASYTINYHALLQNLRVANLELLVSTRILLYIHDTS